MQVQKDTISKDILKSIVKDISKYFLKIDINEVEFIESNNQRVESREADIVAKVNSEFILHLEIQNNNHPKMEYRMLRYWLDIIQNTSLPVRQYLIYIGKEKLKMKNNILRDGVNYIYNIIDMKSIDCDILIKQDTPDALVLSILCDFKKKNPKDVVKYIIDRLIYHTKEDKKEFRKYMLMLEELSTNRDLKEIIKEEAMLREIKWEDLPSYEIGLERGLERGIEKGMERGMEKGKIVALFEIGFGADEIAKKYKKSKKYVNSVINEINKKKSDG